MPERCRCLLASSRPGTILVEPSAGPDGKTIAYCRVSSAEQGDEVERQAGRVAEEAGGRGVTLDATETGGRVGRDRGPRHAAEGLGRSPGERDCGRAPRPACPVRCR